MSSGEVPGLRLVHGDILGGGGRLTPAGVAPFLLPTVTGTTRAICPDRLSIRDIGVADGTRGRIVRAFFVILRKVSGV